MTDQTWNTDLARLPGAHILQTTEWGYQKSFVGWRSYFQRWEGPENIPSAMALVLQRIIPNPGFSSRLSIHYVPKGPILDWSLKPLRNQVLNDLINLARKQGSIFLKIDPDVIIAQGIPGSIDDHPHPLGETLSVELRQNGWRPSVEQIQFRNTFVIQLTADEESMLARMKQKTRYNIRLAQRKGVTIRLGSLDDLDLLYRMYAETSIRDHFTIREKSYYLRTWTIFYQAGMADLLIAEVDREPVAGLILFRFASTAWYMYGMSRAVHREKMPTYLLQWEAIRRARQVQCTRYDLWGAPNDFSEADPMWGVYRFKEGLGGGLIRTIGAWDYPIRPLLYRLYSQILPRLLNIIRLRGQNRTQRSLVIS